MGEIAGMKIVDKMSMRELRGELRATRGLLGAARCPDNGCLQGRIAGKQIGPDTWECYECQWCAERAELLGKNNG